MFKWVKKLIINYAIKKVKDTKTQNEFIDLINEKMDIKWMTEEQEKKFFRKVDFVLNRYPDCDDELFLAKKIQLLCEKDNDYEELI